MEKIEWLIIGLVVAYLLFQDEIMSIGGNLIDKWAAAIQKMEGYFPGSKAYANRNPGNIKASREPWQGQIGIDSSGFVIFDTYENGLRALKISLTNAATGKSSVYRPTDSLFDFFARYAPSTDNNNPNQYALFVAREIGVDPNTPISQLV